MEQCRFNKLDIFGEKLKGKSDKVNIPNALAGVPNSYILVDRDQEANKSMPKLSRECGKTSRCNHSGM